MTKSNNVPAITVQTDIAGETTTYTLDGRAKRCSRVAIACHVTPDGSRAGLGGHVRIETISKSGHTAYVDLPGWVLADFVSEEIARVQANRPAHEVVGVPEGWPGGRWGNRGRS